MLELGLQYLSPVFWLHTRFDLNHLGLSLVVAASVKTFLHSRFELGGNLTVAVSIKDGPLFELRLSEHLALDLAIDFTRTLLDIEAVRSATSVRAHQETTGIVLEALKFLRVLIELQVPKLLLLNAFFICLEVLHQVFDLLNFRISISVHDLCKVLH